MSQALYRKWRPHLWEQVVGQAHIVTTLQNAIRSDRVGHAYLFAGPRGTGKTTTARLLAKAVNCLDADAANRPCDHCAHCTAVNDGRFMDLIEIDAASNTSVDDVRDLRDKINFAPSQGRYKVYIIDEVHMLSTAAFNALLKTLEEPPEHAIFILATTEIHKIPATVLSRCQRFEFRRIPVQTIVTLLEGLCRQEGLTVEEEALTLIARQSTGSMRDAISLLDQLASTGQEVDFARAQQVLGTATSQMVVEVVDAITKRVPSAGLDHIHTALDAGSDARQFARQMVDYLRNLLLARMGNSDLIEATSEHRAQIAQHAQAFELDHLFETLRLFNAAASDARAGWQPGLPLEMAFAQAVSYEKPTITAAAAAEPVVVKSAPPSAEPKPMGAQAPQAEPRKSGSPPPRTPQAKPAVPAEAPASAAHAAVASDTITIQMVLDQWERIRSVVKKVNRSTEAVLNSCKSVTLHNGALTLGFASELLTEKMSKDDNMKITQNAVRQVLGADLPIRCVIVSNKGGAIPADLDVDADGMVSAALSLGGKIIHKE